MRGAAEAWGNDPKPTVVWSQKNKGPGLKAPAPSDLPCFQRPEGLCSLRKHDRSLAELRLLCAAGRKYSARCGEEIGVGDGERDQRDRETRTLPLRWRVLTEEQRRRD